MVSALDLATYRLPLPVVVREMDYEALLSARRAEFTALWESARERVPDLPSIDVLLLETDPASILLEAAAFADLLFIAELNDAARIVRLVSFAAGADLDLHAAEVGLERLAGETDPNLRARVITRRRGSSAAGPDDWYLWHAQAASPDVAEVSIAEGGGWVDVAVRSKNGNGVPNGAMLDSVRAALTARAVRPRCIRVTVSPAVPRVVDIVAAITLDRDAIEPVFDEIRDGFQAAFAAHAKLGRDITRSWLMSALTAPGVKSVDLTAPAADVVVAANEFAALGSVMLVLAGRDW